MPNHFFFALLKGGARQYLVKVDLGYTVYGRMRESRKRRPSRLMPNIGRYAQADTPQLRQKERHILPVRNPHSRAVAFELFIE